MSEADQSSTEPVRVLVGADGSEPALRASRAAAALLPKGTEVRLIVVLSFELDPYTLLGEELEDTPERGRMVHQAVERAVAEPRRVFEGAGHGVTVTHRFGNPADEILNEVQEWNPDLIVVGRRGLTAPGRWLLGSVSDRLVHHAPTPVLVAS
jgi:nucleotide-binding universal stress UspA family protein